MKKIIAPLLLAFSLMLGVPQPAQSVQAPAAALPTSPQKVCGQLFSSPINPSYVCAQLYWTGAATIQSATISCSPGSAFRDVDPVVEGAHLEVRAYHDNGLGIAPTFLNQTISDNVPANIANSGCSRSLGLGGFTLPSGTNCFLVSWSAKARFATTLGGGSETFGYWAFFGPYGGAQQYGNPGNCSTPY